MKRQSLYTLAAILLFAALAAAIPQAAQAANTVAGTTITNQASVNYNVNSVAQTAVTGSVSFVVDRKVDLVVTRVANNTAALPGTATQSIAFLVTNNTNTAIRTALTVSTPSANVWNISGAAVYKDVNNNGTYDGGDTAWDNSATQVNLASGGSVTVLIVGDVPASLPTGTTASYQLVATAYEPVATGWTKITATSGADTAGVDTVFFDAAGTASGDNQYDGMHSATATYTVSSATLAVTKYSRVYWDPVNTYTNPKAIPTAIVLYYVGVSNTGAQDATGVIISDDMSGMSANIIPNTSYDDTNLPAAVGSHAAAACTNGWAYSTDSTTGLDGTWTCGGSSGWSSSKLTAPSGGTTVGNTTGKYWIRYQATIQ